MNCCSNSGRDGKMPVMQPGLCRSALMAAPASPACPPVPAPLGPGPVISEEKFPVGMGYVPVQSWQTPYPLETGFSRGTIFPALDYPFTKGRCRG